MKPLGEAFIAGATDPILVPGPTGFIGPRLVKMLLEHGFTNIRGLVRSSSDVTRIDDIVSGYGDGARVDVVKGNLLSPADCARATRDIAVIFPLAAGRQ